MQPKHVARAVIHFCQARRRSYPWEATPTSPACNNSEPSEQPLNSASRNTSTVLGSWESSLCPLPWSVWGFTECSIEVYSMLGCWTSLGQDRTSSPLVTDHPINILRMIPISFCNYSLLHTTQSIGIGMGGFWWFSRKGYTLIHCINKGCLLCGISCFMYS